MGIYRYIIDRYRYISIIPSIHLYISICIIHPSIYLYISIYIDSYLQHTRFQHRKEVAGCSNNSNSNNSSNPFLPGNAFANSHLSNLSGLSYLSNHSTLLSREEMDVDIDEDM